MAKHEQAEVNSREGDGLDSIVDRDTLDKDMHYRFIHERPQRVARLKAKGYRLVKASEDGVKTVVEDSIGPDDLIRDGDTILMCVPKDRFQDGRKKLATLNRARMSAPKQQFRKKARGAAPGGEDVRVVTADKSDKE